MKKKKLKGERTIRLDTVKHIQFLHTTQTHLLHFLNEAIPCTSILKFGISKTFSEINTFIHQRCIKLIKSDIYIYLFENINLK